MKRDNEDRWLYEIKPSTKLLSLNLKEVWSYKDLLFLFVKRDVITVYKQTILGPLWYIIQPLFTSVIFTLVFNNIANIATDPVPSFLFNLAGITAWNYFKDCLVQTSDTFRKNQAIFGKVYFPRVIMPMSTVVSGLLKFGIQMLMFIIFYAIYAFNGMQVNIGLSVLYLPFLVLFMAMFGLGIGMLISSMVTKYRDLTFLVSFGVQLLMYLSAVVYPLELVKTKLPAYSWIVEYNPLTTIIESFRRIILGTGDVLFVDMLKIFALALITLLFGMVVFNKTEKSFIDTV
ncbi:ABC transporter permease [Pseudofulvibacter geojedonensis]|uniref:Transport permease protein n=1 Tax=Pseudofulvibacter geojedonensis TaxID=1123758 RepID=A0ABW3HYI1_9FLAO